LWSSIEWRQFLLGLVLAEVRTREAAHDLVDEPDRGQQDRPDHDQRRARTSGRLATR
jgi:hypothetical protein